MNSSIVECVIISVINNPIKHLYYMNKKEYKLTLKMKPKELNCTHEKKAIINKLYLGKGYGALINNEFSETPGEIKHDNNDEVIIIDLNIYKQLFFILLGMNSDADNLSVYMIVESIIKNKDIKILNKEFHKLKGKRFIIQS